jgi:hypothetical protein
MKTALTHPDAEVRLQALDQWIERRQPGVAPMMLALNDPDERVRKRALVLIEEDWRREQAASVQR